MRPAALGRSVRADWRQSESYDMIRNHLFALLPLLVACGSPPGEAATPAEHADESAATDEAASGTTARGPADPCTDWVRRMCTRTGPRSNTCGKARAAAVLLPDEACTAALSHITDSVRRAERARADCTTLIDRLCDDLGEDTKTCGVVRKKTPSMPAAKCKAMLDEYDLVLRELRSMEAGFSPISVELAEELAAGDPPSFGPEDAEITIVEFSDFQCPFCKRAVDVVHEIEEQYGDRVRFVFRQFPLDMHEHADLAAEAALAAHAQGKFWEYHDELFAHQDELDRQSLEEHAREIGLDMERFEKALDERTYADRVEDDVKLGMRAGVSGTPTIIVGERRVTDATDYEAVAGLIEEYEPAIQK